MLGVTNHEENQVFHSFDWLLIGLVSGWFIRLLLGLLPIKKEIFPHVLFCYFGMTIYMYKNAHTKHLQGQLTLEKELAVCHQNDYVRLLY